MNAPVFIEIGDEPRTPPAHLEAATAALELLPAGWERAVKEADVSDYHRRVVAETAARVRDALSYHTAPHNLVCMVLAPAFLLSDEPEPATITTTELEALGVVLEWGEDAGHLYPSLFDGPAEDNT